MDSDLPKVLHEIDGKSLIEHVIEKAQSLDSYKTIVILGYKRDLIKERLDSLNIEYAFQNEQLGTGHAIKQCEKNIKGISGNLLILSGDVPLISKDTLLNLIQVHKKNNSQASLVSADIKNPTGYGRIKRDSNNDFISIVEHKDANESELLINEINAGIYIFDIKSLFERLFKINNNNNQNEYYLGDVLKFIAKEKISIYKTQNINEILGINNKEQLNEIIKKTSI